MEERNFHESLKKQIQQNYLISGQGASGSKLGDISLDFGRTNSSADTSVTASPQIAGSPSQTMSGGVKDQGIWASTRLLYGTKEEAKKHYAHLMTGPNTPSGIVRKMGFPEVIATDDPRNDLYVTLVSGELATHAVNRSSDKNIEVKVSLVDEQGRVLPGSIVSTSDRHQRKEDHYYSVVHYHEDKPHWTEIIKIELPEENHNTLHIRFTFRHRSSNENKDKNEKPFALAWLRLIQDTGTMLMDGSHELLVYKIENRKWEENDVSYKSLPVTKLELERSGFTNYPARGSIQASGFVLSNKDSFRIKTLTCSTTLTQNYELLGLLDWESQRSNLRRSLEFLMRSEADKTGEEVVKFLEHILDVLFNIMTKTSDYDTEVFDALVFVISLVGERRYSNFKPVMDRYLESKFHATLAFQKLIPILKNYIDTVEKDHKKPLNALKSLEYLIKFVVRSRQLYIALKPEAINDNFFDTITGLLTSIENLMACRTETGPHVTCQKGVLRHFPAAVPHLCNIYDRMELTKCVVRILNNLQTQLGTWRLNCIKDLVQTELYHNTTCRHLLLPTLLSDVTLRLENSELESDIDLCGFILEDVLDGLYGRDDSPATCSPQPSDLTLLMRHSLRSVVQTVIGGVHTDKQYHKKFVSIMVCILKEADFDHYHDYILEFPCLLDLQDFLMEFISVFGDLVLFPSFPQDWFEMTCLLNSVLLKSLTNLSKTLKDRFMGSEFVSQLWENYFRTTVSFITQDSLQLEEFPFNKRTAVLERYGDMRVDCGKLLRSMWFTLSPAKCKHRFVTTLVGPFLTVSLIPENELRQLTIPIFWDMLSTEYILTHGENNLLSSGRSTLGQDGSRIWFGLFEKELITQLDYYLLECGNKGDKEFATTFINVMRSHCGCRGESSEEGGRVISTVERLLKHLLEYREVKEHYDSVENRMSCIVNLLEFYRYIGQFDLYIRCIYKLYDLHIHCKDLPEAAYTLKLHADRLEWSNAELSSAIILSGLHQNTRTERELKEKLYYKIITLFEQGMHWESALEICKELQYEYENRTFEYEKLVKLLKKMSNLYFVITQQERPNAEYFKVGFYGLGFPQFLANREFVYRGQPYERLSEFNDRIQAIFSDAELLKNLEIPSQEVKKSQSQYLQICSVKPVDEVRNRFGDKKLSKKIKWYYKYNNVQKFELSRKFIRKTEGMKAENEFASLWIQKTVFVTAYRLPGILRWFPITSQNTEELSPLRVAIETVRDANRELKDLWEDALNHFEQKKPYTMNKQLQLKLQGILNPAVMGGISNYEKIFFTDSFIEGATEEETKQLDTLRKTIAMQIPCLEVCLWVHAQMVEDSETEFHHNLLASFRLMKKQVEDKHGKEESLLGKNRSLEIPSGKHRRQIFRHQTHSQNASDQRSSTPSRISTGLAPPHSESSDTKRASNVSNGSNNSGSGDSTHHPPIELSEPLTPRRPRRPETNGTSGKAPLSKSQSGSESNFLSDHKQSNSSLNISLSAQLSIAAFGEDAIEVQKPTDHVTARRKQNFSIPTNHTSSSSSLDDEAPPPLPPRTSVPSMPSPAQTSDSQIPPPTASGTEGSSTQSRASNSDGYQPVASPGGSTKTPPAPPPKPLPPLALRKLKNLPPISALGENESDTITKRGGVDITPNIPVGKAINASEYDK